MGRHSAVAGFFYLLLMVVVATMAGCGQRQQIVYKPLPSSPEPDDPPKVAVVLASDDPVYVPVARQLMAETAHARLFNVKDGERRSAVASVVGRDEYDRVAAIGLPALLAVKDLPDKRIVFSKVFNYADQVTLSGDINSISLLPDPREVFLRWKRLSPELDQVAVVSGDGHSVLLDAIQSAGKSLDITVHPYVVKNDKELVYVSKNLPLEVDGQWLLPDNRITSRDALREVMGNAVRVGRQVVAFDESLFRLGALASIAVADEATASLQWKALNAAETGLSGQKMWFPETFSFEVSENSLKRLGLDSSR